MLNLVCCTKQEQSKDIGAAIMNDKKVRATTAALGWHTGPNLQIAPWHLINRCFLRSGGRGYRIIL